MGRAAHAASRRARTALAYPIGRQLGAASDPASRIRLGRDQHADACRFVGLGRT